MPFTFKLNCHAGAIEEQTLSNRKTGEELLAQRSRRNMIGWVVIKRGAAKAAKEKEKAQS